MLRYSLGILLLASSAGMFLPVNRDALAEGRFLRGQRWQPFAVDGNEANVGLAAGGPDQRVSAVQFEDFAIEVEMRQRKQEDLP